VLILVALLTLAGAVIYFVTPKESSPPNPFTGTFGKVVTIDGTIECLPHKDRSGPQTLECAFGMQGNDGLHYGLSSLNQAKLIDGTVSVGKKVSVTGTLNQPDERNKYDIIGTIDIDKISVHDQQN
jgi:hypothetical protein